MLKILIVEDDLDLSKNLTEGLEKKGYSIEHAPDSRKAEKLSRNKKYDLIILDLSLPGKDGLEFCTDLRNKNDQTPIIILTGRKKINDRVLGLDSGADDYVSKPFSLKELTARIRSILRRRSNERKTNFDNGIFRLDKYTHEFCIKNKRQKLSHKEFIILEILMRKTGEIVSRTELIQTVWGDKKSKLLSNTLEVHISRLRKVAGHRKFIQSFTKHGYMLQPEVINQSKNAK